jgi:uncharacterized protein (TIGR00369 family)
VGFAKLMQLSRFKVRVVLSSPINHYFEFGILMEDILTERFSTVPFQKYLGMTLDSIEGSTIHARIKNRPELMGNELTGILHGGAIASCIDAVGGFVAAQAARLHLESKGEAVERIQKMATIDMRVDYLSPGRGEQFTIKGEALKVGKKMVSTRMALHNDDGLLIAVGSANFLY